MYKKYFLISLLIFGTFLCIYAKKKQSLNLWVVRNNDYNEALDEILYQYEKKTGIRVSIKEVYVSDMRPTLIKSAMEGGGPDLVLGVNDWIGELVDRDIIKDIGKKYKKSAFNDNFPESLYKGVEYKGKLYGLPATMESLILVYNKDLVPTPPQTDEELLEIARSLTNKSEGKFGIAFKLESSYNTMPFVHGFGGYVYDENMNSGLNTEGTINALRFIYDLRNKYQVIPEDVTDETMHTLFYGKKVGMIITGPWDLKDMIKKSKENSIKLDFAILPKIISTNTYMKPFVGLRTYMIVKNTKKEKESLNLITYLTGDDVSKILIKKTVQFPVNNNAYRDITDEKNWYIEKFREQFEKGVPMPNSRVMVYFWSEYKKALKNTLQNETFSSEFIKEAHNNFQSKIDKYENE